MIGEIRGLLTWAARDSLAVERLASQEQWFQLAGILMQLAKLNTGGNGCFISFVGAVGNDAPSISWPKA